jgi:hypothetical protein
MKRSICIWLAVLAAMCALLSEPALAAVSKTAGLSTITVSLKEDPTMKTRTISTGAKMLINARCVRVPLRADQLSFRSTDSSVVCVDAEGVLTSKKPGTADVLVTTRDGKKQAVLRLQVRSRELFYSDDAEESELEKLLKPAVRTNLWMLIMR